MYLFDGNGSRVGEIKEKYEWKLRWILPYFLEALFRGEYFIYDREKVVAQIKLQKRYIDVFIVGNDGEEKKITLSQKSKGIYQYGTSAYKVKKKAFLSDILILNEKNQSIAGLQKGWMPAKLDPIFPNPNTPILTVSEKSSPEEKLIVLALLTKEFLYKDH
jgi:hypothetical protein